MECERDPIHVVAAVARGLIDTSSWLRSAVMVKVPLRRRDQFGWPAGIFAAVVFGLEINEGTLAIWAVSRVVDPVASLNGAAYEFSNWPAPGSLWLETNLTNEDYSSYPEFMAAQQWALRLDGGHIQRV